MTGIEASGYIALMGVGILLGLTGGGGSMLSVPILVYLFSLDVFIASAYSFFIVGTTSVVGAWQKQKSKLIDVRTGVLFGFPSLVSTFCTRKWIIPSVPEVILQFSGIRILKAEFFLGLFAVLITASGVMILLKVNASCRAEEKGTHYLALAGAVTGILAGLAGVGGGFLILPALLLFGRLPFKTAAGTALLVVAANSVSGFLGDMYNYTLDWFFLSSITGLAIAGILVGNYCIDYIPVKQLQKGVALLTLLLGLGMLLIGIGM